MARRSRRVPSRPDRGRVVAHRVAIVLGLAGAVFFLFQGVRDARQDWYLRGAQERASASVVQLVNRGRGGDDARIVYTTRDGRQVTTTVGAYHGTRAGDVISVRYHPGDPARYVEDVRTLPLRFFGAGVAVAGSLGLAALTWLIWRAGPGWLPG